MTIEEIVNELEQKLLAISYKLSRLKDGLTLKDVTTLVSEAVIVVERVSGDMGGLSGTEKKSCVMLAIQRILKGTGAIKYLNALVRKSHWLAKFIPGFLLNKLISLLLDWLVEQTVGVMNSSVWKVPKAPKTTPADVAGTAPV